MAVRPSEHVGERLPAIETPEEMYVQAAFVDRPLGLWGRPDEPCRGQDEGRVMSDRQLGEFSPRASGQIESDDEGVLNTVCPKIAKLIRKGDFDGSTCAVCTDRLPATPRSRDRSIADWESLSPYRQMSRAWGLAERSGYGDGACLYTTFQVRPSLPERQM
jgi:hypothetical protein